MTASRPPWAAPSTLNRRPRALWRGSAIAHHVSALLVRSAGATSCVWPAACRLVLQGVSTTASVTMRTCSAACNASGFPAPCSGLALMLAGCCSQVSCTCRAVLGAPSSSMCRPEFRWLGGEGAHHEAPPQPGSLGRINGACATEKCHWHRGHLKQAVLRPDVPWPWTSSAVILWYSNKFGSCFAERFSSQPFTNRALRSGTLFHLWRMDRGVGAELNCECVLSGPGLGGADTGAHEHGTNGAESS